MFHIRQAKQAVANRAQLWRRGVLQVMDFCGCVHASMVVDGRPWTNECCMCAGRTHAGVGRFGERGGRKGELGPVARSPLGGFGGFRGLSPVNRASRNYASRVEGEGTVQVWGHKRRQLGAHPAGGWWVRWVSLGCETSQKERKKCSLGPNSGALYDGNTAGKCWGTGRCPMYQLQVTLQGARLPHRGGTSGRPGGI